MFNYQIDVLSALTDSNISEFEELDILESDQKLTYTFYALDPPAGFTPNSPLTV